MTGSNLQRYVQDLQFELSKVPELLITTKDASTGSWGMARLWRAWMSTTADWMAANGATMPLYFANNAPVGSREFNHNDAHELFTHRWLGTDSNGFRLSWSKSGRDNMRTATKGERFMALQSHEEYALERGLILINPIDSEYNELKISQNS